MDITTPLDGFASLSISLAVLLSVLVSLIGSSARRRSVLIGQARLRDLCELTGMTRRADIYEAFGPPGMDRVWRHLTLADIAQHRRPLGLLISDQRLDWACAAAAILSFFSDHALIEIALIAALSMQISAWVSAARLPS